MSNRRKRVMKVSQQYLFIIMWILLSIRFLYVGKSWVFNKKKLHIIQNRFGFKIFDGMILSLIIQIFASFLPATEYKECYQVGSLLWCLSHFWTTWTEHSIIWQSKQRTVKQRLGTKHIAESERRVCVYMSVNFLCWSQAHVRKNLMFNFWNRL